jgi:hypothetical protein
MTRPQFGVISLSHDFRKKHLQDPSVRDRIAPLHLGGRLEDYLVKEFMQFVYWRSKGSRFCEGNRGRRGEQRIDIAFVRPSQRCGPRIEAFIEAKYLQNRSFLASSDNKVDEIDSTLNSLASQLKFKPSETYAGLRVDLHARAVPVYGLVFASYVRRATERSDQSDQKEDFFNRVAEVAQRKRLQYHDNKRPDLRPAYENHRVMLAGEQWLVCLRSGLWQAAR